MTFDTVDFLFCKLEIYVVKLYCSIQFEGRVFWNNFTNIIEGSTVYSKTFSGILFQRSCRLTLKCI